MGHGARIDAFTPTTNTGPCLWLNMCIYCSVEDNNVDEIEDLLAYFEQQLNVESSFPKICSPELDLTQMHISGKNLSLFLDCKYA